MVAKQKYPYYLLFNKGDTYAGQKHYNSGDNHHCVSPFISESQCNYYSRILLAIWYFPPFSHLNFFYTWNYVGMATKIQLRKTKSGKTEDCPLNCAQWFLGRINLRYHIYQRFWQVQAFSGYPIFPN
jgi:hypothetical protein